MLAHVGPEMGGAPSVLQHDEVELAGSLHHMAHAGLGGVVGDFQLDAPETELCYAAFDFLHDGTFAQGRIEVAESDEIFGMQADEPGGLVVDLSELFLVGAASVVKHIPERDHAFDAVGFAMGNQAADFGFFPALAEKDGVGMDIYFTHSGQ